MPLFEARAAEQATLGQHTLARMAFPSNLQQLSGPSLGGKVDFPQIAHQRVTLSPSLLMRLAPLPPIFDLTPVGVDRRPEGVSCFEAPST